MVTISVLELTPFGKARRSRGLPENTEYKDTGCDLAHSCLSCPFEVCRYDLPPGTLTLQKVAHRERDRKIYEKRFEEGWTVIELAEEFGVTTKTVFKVLQFQGSRG